MAGLKMLLAELPTSNRLRDWTAAVLKKPVGLLLSVRCKISPKNWRLVLAKTFALS